MKYKVFLHHMKKLPNVLRQTCNQALSKQLLMQISNATELLCYILIGLKKKKKIVNSRKKKEKI